MAGKIGILGAGQLGRMLALAGYPLGLQFRFLDPAPDATAGLLGEHMIADYLDHESLQEFTIGLERVTYEFENVPVEAARFLSQFVPVYPPPQALEAAQDRLQEKELFHKLGIPTPESTAVESKAELEEALGHIGYPAVLKTRRLGYDGKGQLLLESPADIEPGWERLGGTLLILEKYIPFDRELSILACRGQDGTIAFYPLVENWHREGILRLSLAPAPGISQGLQSTAESYARAICENLGYVGVLAVELFYVGGELWANEMAPRVHNSGHWTIDGAYTSQFSNHLRAGLGWPLGCTAARGVTAMVNLIGEVPAPASLLAIESVFVHLYDKTPRPGRKVGHVNVSGGDYSSLKRKLALVQKILPSPEIAKFIG